MAEDKPFKALDVSAMRMDLKGVANEHIESYPLVHSAIESFKAHPYGAQSLDLTQSGYDRFVVPVKPYAAGPYRYVAPYLTRVDQLVCHSLDHVDRTFPIVKADPQALKGHMISSALTPLRLAVAAKEYLLSTFHQEVKKCRGSVPNAAMTTTLVVLGDSLTAVARFLSITKQESSQYVERGRQFVGEKSNQAIRFAQQTDMEMRRFAYRAGDDMAPE